MEIKSINHNNIKDAVIFVQARMESTRLPGKVLKDLSGKPLIIQLMQRLSTLPVKHLVASISNADTSVPLLETLRDQGYQAFAGDPLNVYQRFVDTLQEYYAPCLIRVTADNPLTDCEAIKNGIIKLIKEDLDFLWMNNSPKGFGCDIFKTKTFLSFKNKELSELEKEHIVPIFRNRNYLKGEALDCSYPKGAENLNFSVDTYEEYLQMQKTFNKYYNEKYDLDLNQIVKDSLES